MSEGYDSSEVKHMILCSTRMQCPLCRASEEIMKSLWCVSYDVTWLVIVSKG